MIYEKVERTGMRMGIIRGQRQRLVIRVPIDRGTLLTLDAYVLYVSSFVDKHRIFRPNYTFHLSSYEQHANARS